MSYPDIQLLTTSQTKGLSLEEIAEVYGDPVAVHLNDIPEGKRRTSHNEVAQDNGKSSA